MREITPTLVISFGQEIANAVSDSLVEASEYSDFMSDYDLYQFLFFNPMPEAHKKFTEKEYVSTSIAEDQGRSGIQKEEITKLITDEIRVLERYENAAQRENYAN